MHDDVDKELRIATEQANRGEFDQALERVDRLVQLYPERAAVFGVMGGLLFRMNRFGQALEYFRRATELAPKSELASLGLFHCLWGLGRETDAKAEVTRLLSLRSSEDYDELLEDMGWHFDSTTNELRED